MIGALAVVAAITAEALAAYAAAEWLAAAYPQGQHAVSGASLAIAGLIAYAWPRFAGNFTFPARVVRALTGAVAFAVLYGLLRIEFAGDFALWDVGWVASFVEDSATTVSQGRGAIAGAALLTALWVRSSLRAAGGVELDMVPRTLGLPFAAVTVIVVLAGATSHAGEVGRAGLAFYAVAVVALACSQLAQSGATFGDLRAGGVTAALLSGLAAAVTFCVAVFGVVFGYFGSPVGAAVWFAVRVVLTIVLTPVAWFFAVIANALLGGRQIEFEQFQSGGTDPLSGQPAESQGVLGHVVTYGTRALALLAAVAIVAGLVFVVSAARRRYRPQPLEMGERGTVAPGDGSRPSWWHSLLHRSGREWGDSQGIFRLYRDVLGDAEREGAIRRPSETPEEFAPVLASQFQTPVTSEITLAFEEARYGGHEPAPALMADLERRWRERRP